MKPPIYKPRGAAAEYGDLAINISLSCPHKCYYCYCPTMLRKNHGDFFDYKGPRPGIVDAVKRQLDKEGLKGSLIHISFIGDPYPVGYDSSVTRDIIKTIKESGNHVQILTKGGTRAERDFDLLDSEDWFGVSYAGYEADKLFEVPKTEPGSAPPSERLESLKKAHNLGIKTWMSCEPVIDDRAVYELIGLVEYVDLFKIGKLNYYPSKINWHDFGHKIEALCKTLGLNYYIKEDLRREMDS